jgi:hypothetical protein
VSELLRFPVRIILVLRDLVRPPAPPPPTEKPDR